MLNPEFAPRSKPEEAIPVECANEIKEINDKIADLMYVLLKGCSEDLDTYKPWKKKEVKKQLLGLFAMIERKINVYLEANQTAKLTQIKKKLETYSRLVLELETSEEVPEDFLQRVREAIEEQ